MIQTNVTVTLALAGFAPAGKPDYTNRQERFCHTRNSMEALRLVVAIAILSVSASWAAFGQTQLGPAGQPQAAPVYTVLYAFTGADGNSGLGGSPFGPLILDRAGNLYGTTQYGGDLSCGNFSSGCGVVYRVDPIGTETVLYTFTGGPTGGPDGGYPVNPLARDAAGTIYGVTSGGGTAGYGVVFKVDKVGHEKVLYNFTGGADGGQPYGVIRDSAGNLYGTTGLGGDLSACNGGCGVVFKVDCTGKETVLYTFTGGPDGGLPSANLVRDGAGNLYGTTVGGGDPSCQPFVGGGCGVVFKVDRTGKEAVLHAFTGSADGGSPLSSLVLDKAGNLYGTTQAGGDNSTSCVFLQYGCGVVFKLDQTGKETVLYTFTDGPDGGLPQGGVVRDAAGNLYGTAADGGYGYGVVYKVSPAGKETVLYSFTGGADGAYPQAGLAARNTGTAYELHGVTTNGGDVSGICAESSGCGVVFKLTLPRVAETDPN